MGRGTVKRLICSMLIGGLVFSGGKIAFARVRHEMVSPVAIKIKVPKKEYKVDEPLNGQVILTNLSPTNMPAVFEIRIYHEDELVSSLSTALKAVPQGNTKFSFKHFGFPDITKGPKAEGRWRFYIYQRGLDPEGAVEAEIQVVPAAADTKPTEKRKSKHKSR